jgi:gamma-glutamyl:cysteine ligase YbdK (ATP-grasp superfamily)
MPRYSIFQGYGIELEYMIVDCDTLVVKPIADELLKHELGAYGSDFENGIITWSNELVLHVIEIKSTKPESDFDAVEKGFVENVKRINSVLSKWNCMLLPTAAHPFMEPLSEAKLWPHDNNEVYEIYNKIFDCRGHGWSNLQSTHLNLPFDGEEQFAKLHAAIRLVLPILPALCASSPILDGKPSGLLDTRLHYYKDNQKKIPSITGRVIPEPVFTEADYSRIIYDPIKRDIEPFDAQEILDAVWVNSRGAISRFDRGSIEIRLMDVQECPAADLAIQTLVIETIKALTNEAFIKFDHQIKWDAEPLAKIFESGIAKAERAIITNKDYLEIFGSDAETLTAGELWKHILSKLMNSNIKKRQDGLNVILSQGSLSTRILQSLNGDYSASAIKNVYKKLSACLSDNRMLK